jgi:hypothetical protein
MHLFYNTSKLSLKEKKYILEEAKRLSFRWWVDELDGIYRKKVDLSWTEIMAKIKSAISYTVILRDYPDMETKKNYGEIGFTTNDNFYLWIYVEDQNFEQILNQFHLKPIITGNYE